ncbi:hypothetical protein HJFPF1_01011 [Paramyrothecium foliicola]|nr:hypothetical protein HJFPF1_01011 [Paramyrothecium foliicola]
MASNDVTTQLVPTARMDASPASLPAFDVGDGSESFMSTAKPLPNRPNAHQQTIIVATVFSIGLVAAIAITVGVVMLRRRAHRLQARQEQRKAAAVRAVARSQWGLSSGENF